MKLVKPDLENRDFEFNESLQNPDISREVLQALTYLIGYDSNSDIFRFLNSDSEGRLYVSSGAVKTNSANVSVVSVGTTAILVVADNDNRKSIEVFNNSSNTIYLGFSTGVTIALGFPLPAGANWYNDTFTGNVYGISAVASNDIRVIEMS